MLILWKSKETPEDRGDNMPCAAFRWVLAVGRWYVGLIHQHRFKDDAKWYSSHTLCYEIGLARSLSFGFHHIYYDGPHCGFAFAWLRVQWSPLGGWCTKCMPD